MPLCKVSQIKTTKMTIREWFLTIDTNYPHEAITIKMPGKMELIEL